MMSWKKHTKGKDLSLGRAGFLEKQLLKESARKYSNHPQRNVLLSEGKGVEEDVSE
jgi:hypothetical protein